MCQEVTRVALYCRELLYRLVDERGDGEDVEQDGDDQAEVEVGLFFIACPRKVLAAAQRTRLAERDDVSLKPRDDLVNLVLAGFGLADSLFRRGQSGLQSFF